MNWEELVAFLSSPYPNCSICPLKEIEGLFLFGCRLHVDVGALPFLHVSHRPLVHVCWIFKDLKKYITANSSQPTLESDDNIIRRIDVDVE